MLSLSECAIPVGSRDEDFPGQRNKSWKEKYTVTQAFFCHSVDDLFSSWGLGQLPCGPGLRVELPLSVLSGAHSEHR